MVKPMLTKPNVVNSIIGKIAKNITKLIGTPRINPRKKTITPCKTASVLSPIIFPMKIEKREIGATKISFMNPNSLSQITEMPMNMAVNNSVCPIMPGKMNC